MASLSVRQSLRAALQAAFPSVPFVDTAAKNVDKNSLPALWMAMEFVSDGERRMSIGHPTSLWRESGTCVVLVVGTAGAGDASIVAQATAVKDYFRYWQDASENIRVNSIGVQASQGDESDGRWFIVPVAIEYERDFFA